MKQLNTIDMFSAVSHYHTMWIYAMFDLPVKTKLQRKKASLFRKGLLQDGFTMLQFSVYIRHCASRENAAVHERRVKLMVPDEGSVSVLLVTDKQFGDMKTFYGLKNIPSPPAPVQLEFF